MELKINQKLTQKHKNKPYSISFVNERISSELDLYFSTWLDSGFRGAEAEATMPQSITALCLLKLSGSINMV